MFIQQGPRLCPLALWVSLALPAIGSPNPLSQASSLQQSASADDWCQFRGPTGDGLSQATNVPVTWSTNHNVKWRSAVPGVGRSSPVLLGRRIWLTTALASNVRTFSAGPDRMQQAERVVIGVVCLDRAGGEQLYYQELFAVDNPPAINAFNSYATPTPVVEPGRLYCDFGTFGTACLDSDSGEVLWKRRLPLEHYQGPGSSPALYKNLLILVRDGKTVVFQADKALPILAENQLDGPVFASPAVVNSAIYLRTDGHLYCLASPVTPVPH